MARHFTWQELHPGENKKCKYCGKEFVPKQNGARVKHCSDECFEIDRRERHRECARRNQKNWESYKKKNYHSDYSERECLQCGEIFTPRKGSPQQKYCSNKCADRAVHGVTKKELKCKSCGKLFEAYSYRNYCSDECRNYKEPVQIEIRACKKCGKMFTVASNLSQTYCSAECRDTPLMYHHTCEICGKEFDNWQPVQFACSGKCKEIRDRRKARELRTDHGKVKERFEKEKIIDKGITWKKIMLRDGCNCGICGLPVDINDFTYTENGAFIAGANYPSIDHIIPRAKGGFHSWDNVQLAHFYCNTIKCDTMEVTA